MLYSFIPNSVYFERIYFFLHIIEFMDDNPIYSPDITNNKHRQEKRNPSRVLLAI